MVEEARGLWKLNKQDFPRIRTIRPLFLFEAKEYTLKLFFSSNTIYPITCAPKNYVLLLFHLGGKRGQHVAYAEQRIWLVT
jgi:hypothetical protein